MDGKAHERGEFALGVGRPQGPLVPLLFGRQPVGQLECTRALVVVESEIENGRLANGKCDVLAGCWRQHELDSTAVWQFCREQRLFSAHFLVGAGRDLAREFE